MGRHKVFPYIPLMSLRGSETIEAIWWHSILLECHPTLPTVARNNISVFLFFILTSILLTRYDSRDTRYEFCYMLLFFVFVFFVFVLLDFIISVNYFFFFLFIFFISFTGLLAFLICFLLLCLS